jgi:thioredoxin 1
MQSLPAVEAAEFDAVVASLDPTLVMFTAVWCTNCRRTTPEARALAADNPWSLQVRQVLVDDTPALAQRFEVQSIPTALLFKGGELLQRIQPKAAGDLKTAVAAELDA